MVVRKIGNGEKSQSRKASVEEIIEADRSVGRALACNSPSCTDYRFVLKNQLIQFLLLPRAHNDEGLFAFLIVHPV